MYPHDLYDRINRVFLQTDAMTVKQDAVRDIYLDYGFQKSGDGKRGIVPGRDVADFFFGEDGFVRLSWDVVAYVIGALVRDGEYLPYREEEDAIGDFDIPDESDSDEQIPEEYSSGGTEDAQADTGRNDRGGQLSLFELYPNPYQEGGEDGDQILSDAAEGQEETPGYVPFPIGSRIAYDSRIFEVLGYLDDNHTVELGDIEQQTGLGHYKVRERLPVALIEEAKQQIV
ncbi:MAG TPA: hypothetical protein DF613_04830, partial [Lachnospiraceae bacterium]|nr:hypothetical protein [Lachnospiraceae bacterium]